MKSSQNEYTLFSTDGRPAFTINEVDLLDAQHYEIFAPKVVLSSEQQNKRKRKISRQSVKKENERISGVKLEAKQARENWIKNEFARIKKESYTQEDFLTFIKKVEEPFKYKTLDGYEAFSTGSENICVNSIALQAIDGVLCQKAAAEELSRVEALERKRKVKKRKRTPNTTRSDDGLGVCMQLQLHDFQQEDEEKQKQIQAKQKHLKQRKSLLTDVESLVSRRGEDWNYDKMSDTDLKTLLKLCCENSGMLSKPVRVKRLKLMDANVSLSTAILRKHELITNINQLEKELNALTVLSIDLLPEKETEDEDHSRTAEIILDL